MTGYYKTYPVIITKITDERIYFVLKGATFFVPRDSELVIVEN